MVLSTQSVLVVVNSFSEDGGRRFDKLVKYLVRMGVRVTVLTGKRIGPSSLQHFGPQATPSGVSVHRTGLLFDFYTIFSKLGLPGGGRLDRFFGFSEGKIWWGIPLLRRADALYKQERYRVVITSSPPEILHFVGWYLKARYGLPWIADFRDLWTLYPARYKSLTPLHARVSRRLEIAFYDHCNQVIANTSLNKDMICTEFGIPREKVQAITNGYDPEDHKTGGVNGNEGMDSDGLGQNSISIGYFGGLEKGARFPTRELMMGLRQALNGGCLYNLHIWGASGPSRSLSELISDLDLASVIHFHGKKGHLEALSLVSQCDVLLVYMAADRPEYQAVVPQKLYHYLGVGKHILAIVPVDGLAADIIRSTRTGCVVEPEESKIAEALKTLYRYGHAGPSCFAPDTNAMIKFQHPVLARQLLDVIQRVDCSGCA